MRTPLKTISLKKALLKAQNMCSVQEKCESDIRKKCHDWKLPVDEHDKLIKILIEDNFVDDQRYASFFAKEKFRLNKWGKIKIEYAMKQKNISANYIKNALAEIPDNEYEEVLKSELIKKIKTIKEKDEYTVKSKLLRFAASRGFENGKVFDMVSTIIEKNN